MNQDFHDILSAFSDAEVEYLLVGAYALSAHGLVRATGDIDLWVRPTEQNAQKTYNALTAFGAPAGEFSVADFHTPDQVIQIGVAPVRIDILTSISGVEFDDAWGGRDTVRLDDLEIPVLSRAHLIQNKRASARPQDLVDLAWLEDDANQ